MTTAERKAPGTRRKKPTNPEFKTERTMRQDLLHLRRLSREAGDLSAKAKAAAAKKAEFEKYVIDRMEYEEVDSQRADHTSFTPSRTLYANVQDKGAFIAWAQENDPGLLKPDAFREGDLNALVRRLTDDGEALPPGLGFYVKEKISMRASGA